MRLADYRGRSLRISRIHPLSRAGIALVLSALISAANSEAFTDELRFQTSAVLLATVYHDRSWGAKDTAEDGAFSSVNRRWDQTRSGTWYIEQQRAGDQIIATGLAYHDRVLVDRGLRILEWGFAQQNADGSFPCEDPFHSTSFFVEAATHSVLLLEAAPRGPRV